MSEQEMYLTAAMNSIGNSLSAKVMTDVHTWTFTCIRLACLCKSVAVNHGQGFVLPALLAEAALEDIQELHC